MRKARILPAATEDTGRNLLLHAAAGTPLEPLCQRGCVTLSLCHSAFPVGA